MTMEILALIVGVIVALLFLVVFAPPQSQKVICAWCGAVILEGRNPISHGICPTCATKILHDEDA